MNAKTMLNRLMQGLPMLLLALSGCSDVPPAVGVLEEGGEVAAADYPRGSHNGRLLEDGEFALELAIFETGVPPEFHAWATYKGMQLQSREVDLEVRLNRLGNEIFVIEFQPEGDFLRSTSVVHEPHSFAVTVEASYQGMSYRWNYESFEGRTMITPELSKALGIETSIATAATLQQRVEVLGSIVSNHDYSRSIYARFDGVVKSVSVSLGEHVDAGAPLVVIESNESLKPYTITAPISGVVTARNVNPGEQAGNRLLLEVVDQSHVWAELAIFPAERAAVQQGAQVTITPTTGGQPVVGTINGFANAVGAAQSLIARVPLENTDGRLVPGTFVTAVINSGEISVPLVVRREGLQTFRDFTVVFAKVGNEYEVRMLELGRQDADHIEVLGGLEPGTEYVTTNSYIVKADVEKSGASHDH